jgi:hypothetical protein
VISAAGHEPLFEGGLGVFALAGNGGFVALAGAPLWLLWALADGFEQSAHMDGIIGDAKLQANDRSDPSVSPDLSTKAIGLGPAVQEFW